MIPRFNIKRIKNRLVGNTRWTDYLPNPVQFAQDTLSPGKYVVEVNDGTGHNIDTDAFDEFRGFYDKTQSGPSFDEVYTGATAFDIQVPADERYDFITFYRDYAYDVQLRSFADDLIYLDDYDQEIESIPVYVKTKFVELDGSRAYFSASFVDVRATHCSPNTSRWNFGGGVIEVVPPRRFLILLMLNLGIISGSL